MNRGADDVFSCVLKWRDELMGLDLEQTFYGDTPYQVAWAIFYDRNARPCGRRRIEVKHDTSGATKIVTVDFDGVDEDGFSAPLVVNEKALDAWSEACGVGIAIRAD